MNKDEILEKVLKVIKNHFKKLKIDVGIDTHLVDDIGADSLDAMEIVMLLEDEFEIIIPETKLEGVKIVGRLYDIVIETLEEEKNK
jgi:acyl carrier protein